MNAKPERIPGRAGGRLGRDHVCREREKGHRAEHPDGAIGRLGDNSRYTGVISQATRQQAQKRADHSTGEHRPPPPAEPRREGGLGERAPEVAAGQVVRDRESGALLEWRCGRGQDAQAAPGQRVANRDQVADVPVAAGDDQRPEPEPRGAQPIAARRDRDDADGETQHRPEHGQLDPDSQPGRDRGEDQCRGPVGVVDQERHRGQQEEHRDDVVGRGAGLGVVHHRGRHGHRRAEQRAGADAPGAPDAVGGEKGQPEPQQVQTGRQRVASEEHDPQPVKHLGGGGIERRQVLDVGEAQRHDVPRLREARRPREVVPERIEAADADVVGLDRQRPPLRDHGGGSQDRQPGEEDIGAGQDGP